MVFPVVGGTQDTTPYEISNSLRFNNDDSASMTIASLGSSSSNAKKWTVSFWAKLGPGLTAHRCVFSAGEASGGEYVQINFSDEDKLQIYSSNQFGQADNTATVLRTNALYRDVSAWYHVVYAIDFTDGTAGDRIKLYVNGSRVTSFELSNNIPAQNTDNDRIGANNIDHFVGKFVDSSSEFFDGYLAEFHFIDGDAKASTDFGKTDDNGVWIPKKYGGSHGNNGFYLQFKETGTSQNASGIGADTSGNDNHFAVTNLAATDVTVDTPTNNFCTVNPLGGTNSSGKWTFSEGNTQIQQNDNGNWRATGSTMAVAKGKWYWEIEFDAGDMSEIFVGVHDSEVSLEGTNRWVAGSTLFYNHNSGEVRQDGTNTSNDYGTLTAGDILGVALNMDDNQISFYDNGSAIVSNFGLSSSITGFAMPTFMSDASDIVYKVNFGNAPFAISSGNSDANGYGNFEYAVPSGYYALCTKNLAEYG